MKKVKKFADGGLSGIAESAQDLMTNVSDMANTINYGTGNTGGQQSQLGFNAVAGMKKGGSVSAASKRADGCAQRGKTRGRVM